MLKHKLVDFIIQFMEEVDKEISEMKLFVSLPGIKCLGTGVDILLAERAGEICGRVFPNACKYFQGILPICFDVDL